MSVCCELACGDFADFAGTDHFIAIIAITFGAILGGLGILGGTVTTIVKTRAKELTKRELAAYVAEGTIDPDKAILMLNAGLRRWELPKTDPFMGKSG